MWSYPEKENMNLLPVADRWPPGSRRSWRACRPPGSCPSGFPGAASSWCSRCSEQPRSCYLQSGTWDQHDYTEQKWKNACCLSHWWLIAKGHETIWMAFMLAILFKWPLCLHLKQFLFKYIEYCTDRLDWARDCSSAALCWGIPGTPGSRSRPETENIQ